MKTWTNARLKTALGWFILGSNFALLGFVFFLEGWLNGKISPPERSMAFAAIIPLSSTYLTAAVAFFMAHKSATQTKWALEEISVHTAIAALALPTALFIAGLAVIWTCAMGRFTSTQFGDYLTIIQSLHGILCSAIYGNLFRKELEAQRKQESKRRQGNKDEI